MRKECQELLLILAGGRNRNDVTDDTKMHFDVSPPSIWDQKRRGRVGLFFRIPHETHEKEDIKLIKQFNTHVIIA